MATRQELKVARDKRREVILDEHARGQRQTDIASIAKCSVSTVSNTICDARNDNDPRATMSEKEMEMKRAELYQDAVVKEWRLGRSIDEIAKMYGLHAREVRAAVYLAIKDDKAGGVFSQPA